MKIVILDSTLSFRYMMGNDSSYTKPVTEIQTEILDKEGQVFLSLRERDVFTLDGEKHYKVASKLFDFSNPKETILRLHVQGLKI